MIRQVVCAVLILAVFAGVVYGDATSDLYRIFEDEWKARLEDDPLFATSIGDNRFNDRLPSVDVAHQIRRGQRNHSFLKRLKAIDASGLEKEDATNYRLFERMLVDRVAEFEYRQYLLPISNRSGFHISFPQLPDWVPLNTVEDYDNYVARLEGFATYATQNMDLLRAGAKQGIVLPLVVLEGYEETINPHIVEDPTESLLFVPFEKFPDKVHEADRERLIARGKAAIAKSVVPGYRALAKFWKDTYLPAARTEIGASGLPKGREFYAHRVRRFTTLDLTPEQVHETGKSEVARIRAEMQDVIDGVGFEGSFAEFVTFLRTDEQFYVDSPEQLMKEVAYVLKKMDGELPKLFNELPRMPYGIKRVPDFIAPKTTTAYYNRPAGDGTRAGYYYVNCYDLPSRPLYEIEALSLHEAVPGHHLQIALMQELGDVPNFRRYGGFTAFVEGWALYAERLGLECGFYEDPYSNFGRLTYEMWRALRLVVDTGIHNFDWTRQQAIDLMVENCALTVHNITTEVDRYISWPGQALAYKTGELKIRELRATAEKRMGDAFDIREFHAVVLGSGAVSLDILESNVQEYIETASSE